MKLRMGICPLLIIICSIFITHIKPSSDFLEDPSYSEQNTLGNEKLQALLIVIEHELELLNAIEQ